MYKFRDWGWPSYFFFYALLTINAAVAFFSPNSTINTYYQIATAYHIYFFIPYLLNALYLIMEILGLVPLFLYASNQTFLSWSFWQGVFIFRLLLNFVGRSYEINFLKSIVHDQPNYAFAILALTATITIPSFVGHWKYAFKHPRQL